MTYTENAQIPPAKFLFSATLLSWRIPHPIDNPLVMSAPPSPVQSWPPRAWTRTPKAVAPSSDFVRVWVPRNLYPIVNQSAQGLAH